MVEVPITRICKYWPACLLAAALVCGPASAKRDEGGTSLNKYVAARLADASNLPDVAAAAYAEAFKLQPNNALVAKKAYVKAIETGNFPLAIDAVKALQLRGKIDAEMPSLIFSEAFVKGDWRAAEIATVELESLGNFSFLSPLLNAWVVTAKGKLPLAELAQAKNDKTAKYYHDEQKILHQLVRGDDHTAMRTIGEVVEANEARMASFRLLVACHFLAKNDPTIALNILKFKRTGPEAILYREIGLGNGNRYARKIDARLGTAFLFQRISTDLALQKAYFLALVLTQNAVRLDVDNDYSQLILGQSYSNSGNTQAEIEAFSKIDQNSPYYLVALSSEISALITDDQFERANQRIAQAIQKNKTAPELRILEGQISQSGGNFSSAVNSFSKAIELARNVETPIAVLANYWLLLGGAQEQAGLWPEGLESLKKANDLRPNSANILNYLGYAQLERRENIADAIKAIKKAHELRSSSPAITDSLGWAYFINGEHTRAVDLLERARSGQPQDPTINEHLGDAYWKVGREYEARYAWKSAKLFAEKDDLKRLSDKIELGFRSDLVSP